MGFQTGDSTRSPDCGVDDDSHQLSDSRMNERREAEGMRKK
jgi:hypothetical protein